MPRGAAQRHEHRSLLVCVALAGASLLLLRVASYDPSAWLVWGREVVHGDLNTFASPSWKPLPVALTAVFSLAGSGAAPLLWLFVARAGGFCAIVLAHRLARRLGGSGWVAAIALTLGTDFLYNTVRGDSEGLLVALTFAAVLLHLDRRTTPAFTAVLLAAALRPEVWPFAGLYGIWLMRADPRPAARLAIGGAGALLLAAWFVPDYIATGDWLRGATRATQPEPGSPGQSAFPVGATLLEALRFLVWAMYPAVVIAVVRAWRARSRTAADVAVLALAAGALVLTFEVAALAQGGFTGNIRYLTLPGAILAVVGGAGLPAALAVVRRRAPSPVQLSIAVAIGLGLLASVRGVVHRAQYLSREEPAMGPGLQEAIELAGGTAAVRVCGGIAASPYQRSQVAYALGVHQVVVGARASARGTMFVRNGRPAVGAGRLPVVGRTPDWTVRSSCRHPLPVTR